MVAMVASGLCGMRCREGGGFQVGRAAVNTEPSRAGGGGALETEVGMVVAVWAEAGMVGGVVTNEVVATEEVTAEEQMASL